MKQKFSLKQYKKDKQKCYEMSKSGINLDQLSKTEERISSKKINTFVRKIKGNNETSSLINDAEICNKKDALGLCSLPFKDRNFKKCEYCDINI